MGVAEIQETASPQAARRTLDYPDLSACSKTICALANGRAARFHGGSRMSGDVHVRFYESLGVQLLGATHRNIYVRSERAGQRVMDSIKRFITQRLKLKVNEKKSAVAQPQVRKFLGFSFTDGPVIRRTIAPKAVERFKERIREITRQARSVSLDQTMAVLAPYMRGWRGYFGFCETPDLLIQLTRWVLLRLRAALWRHWKT